MTIRTASKAYLELWKILFAHPSDEAQLTIWKERVQWLFKQLPPGEALKLIRHATRQQPSHVSGSVLRCHKLTRSWKGNWAAWVFSLTSEPGLAYALEDKPDNEARLSVKLNCTGLQFPYSMLGETQSFSLARITTLQHILELQMINLADNMGYNYIVGQGEDAYHFSDDCILMDHVEYLHQIRVDVDSPRMTICC